MRYFWQLERMLADPIPELELPAPLRLVAGALELVERDASSAKNDGVPRPLGQPADLG